MKAITDKRSVIGECPIWNSYEQRLYTVNGLENEILIYDIFNNTVKIRKTPVQCAAICFSDKNEIIISHSGGVSILNSDNSLGDIYDKSKYCISNANDMKVGPDGHIYVGTQSEKRLGTSEKIDGRLYSIDEFGNVRTLLDGLLLSNGLDWSPTEDVFYHTDSDTGRIREYAFNKAFSCISYTGRSIKLDGVDGFSIAKDGDIYAASWGHGYIAVIDSQTLEIRKKIPIPAKIPASCGFVGKDFEFLAVTTASFGLDKKDEYAGKTFLYDVGVNGKMPYYYHTVKGEKH